MESAGQFWHRRTGMVCALIAFSAFSLLVGCGEETGEPATRPEVGAPAPASAAPALAASEPKEEEKTETEAPILTDEMFVESAESRDPFRSFLGDVTTLQGEVPTDLEVLMKEYSLDELRLIATVSGGAAPRAMFRDPRGDGVIVRRGDHISRSAARITRILRSKVFVEIEQYKGIGQEPEKVVRDIAMDPEDRL